MSSKYRNKCHVRGGLQRENLQQIIIIKKKRFRARKQGWNKKMAADDSDIEDFKIDKETVLDNKINLKLYNCIIV